MYARRIVIIQLSDLHCQEYITGCSGLAHSGFLAQCRKLSYDFAGQW